MTVLRNLPAAKPAHESNADVSGLRTFGAMLALSVPCSSTVAEIAQAGHPGVCFARANTIMAPHCALWANIKSVSRTVSRSNSAQELSRCIKCLSACSIPARTPTTPLNSPCRRVRHRKTRIGRNGLPCRDDTVRVAAHELRERHDTPPPPPRPCPASRQRP
jgi:hypothetical protein